MTATNICSNFGGGIGVAVLINGIGVEVLISCCINRDHFLLPP